jgi:hypothetical protein
MPPGARGCAAAGGARFRLLPLFGARIGFFFLNSWAVDVREGRFPVERAEMDRITG